MKATYNLETRVLVVSGKEILPFTAIVPENEFYEYWDTVVGLDGNSLYDINIWFDHFDDTNHSINNPKNWQAQYVDLVGEGDDIRVGDDYRQLELTVIKEKVMKKVLYVKRLVFLDWYANDKEDYQNIGEMIVDSLKQGGIVTVSIEDLFEGMVDLSCIPANIISNIKDFPNFEQEDWDYDDYEFELID